MSWNEKKKDVSTDVPNDVRESTTLWLRQFLSEKFGLRMVEPTEGFEVMRDYFIILPNLDSIQDSLGHLSKFSDALTIRGMEPLICVTGFRSYPAGIVAYYSLVVGSEADATELRMLIEMDGSLI